MEAPGVLGSQPDVELVKEQRCILSLYYYGEDGDLEPFYLLVSLYITLLFTSGSIITRKHLLLSCGFGNVS
jgi:hypothetical protein